MTVAHDGAVYAALPAAQSSLAVTPEHRDLVSLGRESQWASNDTEHVVHATVPPMTGRNGAIPFDELGDATAEVHQRTVTVLADVEVDRSSCGSGTCARLAAPVVDGRLPAGTGLQRESIVGSTIGRTVLDTTDVDGRPPDVPQVTGMAYRTRGPHFSLDPDVPLVPGFVLR